MIKDYKAKETAELLVALKKHQFLADFNLSLYCAQDGAAAEGETLVRQICSITHNPFSSETVIPYLEKHIQNVLKIEKPVVCRLHGGLLGFLVPFPYGVESLCLVGEGVREKSINILKLEELCRASKSDVFEVLEQIEKLPVKTYKEVEEAVSQAKKILLKLREKNTDLTSFIDKTRNQLAIMTRSLSLLDEVKTAEELITFSSDILRTLFNFQKIAFALCDEKSKGYLVKGTFGLPEELGNIAQNKLSFFIDPNSPKKIGRISNEMRELFPGLTAEIFACFSLEAHGEVLGFVAVFDSGFEQTDGPLMELLANRITARFIRLKKEREHALVGSLSDNLMSFTNTLLFAENKEELYKTVLEIAADLVGASRGSIMLIDKNGKNLQIGFCKGMNSSVAQSITVKLGEGIAGKVACSGVPLLVDDVEKDDRVRMPNRPRFKTKSLLCVPLKLKDKTIGVLNLSDKEDMGAFNESDLNLLASFANLASLMIERTWALERSFQLEKLSITDHMTGLYNHRFLRTRLEEELNRSTRNGLNLSVIFIDLDFFKVYNDISGHLAGDAALKKVAEILKVSVRDMDVVVRYGGEEFCIVLPDTSKKEAVHVAERIRQEIEKERFSNEENLPFGRLTASFGIASFPEDGHTFTTLIHSADLALYKAKAEGRNRVELGRPVLPKEVA
jgi:diguanylate cyclase (GGDEF)-like protein